ncbi:PRI2 primase, partial [Polyodon spathula]|nr:PRI2 primase [Polyodon spathula]
MQFSRGRRQKVVHLTGDRQADLYPQSLQFYGQPPTENISLSEFETFAVDRLKLLKTVENLGVSYVKTSETYSKKLEGELRKLQFPYREGTEMDLFRYRFQTLTKEGAHAFLKFNNLHYESINDEEKNKLREKLIFSTFGCSGIKVEHHDFYKVPFQDVLDLVRGRKVYLREGSAYIPHQEIVAIVLNDFRTRLSKALALTARSLPEVQSDERLQPLLNHLSQAYVGQDYSIQKNIGKISLEQIDPPRALWVGIPIDRSCGNSRSRSAPVPAGALYIEQASKRIHKGAGPKQPPPVHKPAINCWPSPSSLTDRHSRLLQPEGVFITGPRLHNGGTFNKFRHQTHGQKPHAKPQAKQPALAICSTGPGPLFNDSPGFSTKSYPLCMRHLHKALRENHHLRHGGRMQYGLFLKGIGLTLEQALQFWRSEFIKGKVDADKCRVSEVIFKRAQCVRHRARELQQHPVAYQSHLLRSLSENHRHSPQQLAELQCPESSHICLDLATLLQQFDKTYAYSIRHSFGKEGKRTDYTPYSCMKIILSNPPSQGDHHGCPFRHSDPELLKQKLQSYKIHTNGISQVLDLVKGMHYQLACQKYFELTHSVDDCGFSLNHPNQYFVESQRILNGGREIKTEVTQNETPQQTNPAPKSASAPEENAVKTKVPPKTQAENEMEDLDQFFQEYD